MKTPSKTNPAPKTAPSIEEASNELLKQYIGEEDEPAEPVEHELTPDDSPEEKVHEAGFPEIAALIRWSQNYDARDGTPFQLFCDLTGTSERAWGDTMFNYSKLNSVMAYTELDYLADALKEYVRTPDRANAALDAYLSYDPEAEEPEEEDEDGGYPEHGYSPHPLDTQDLTGQDED